MSNPSGYQINGGDIATLASSATPTSESSIVNYLTNGVELGKKLRKWDSTEGSNFKLGTTGYKINGDDIGNKIAPFSTVFKGKEGERGNFENRTSATYNGGNGNSNNSNVNIPTGTKFISGFIIGGGGGGGGTRNGSKAKAGGGGGGAGAAYFKIPYVSGENTFNISTSNGGGGGGTPTSNYWGGHGGKGGDASISYSNYNITGVGGNGGTGGSNETGNNYPYHDNGGIGGGVNVSSAVSSNMYTEYEGGNAAKSNGSQPGGNSGFLAAAEGIKEQVYPNRNDYMYDSNSNNEISEKSWYRTSTGHYASTKNYPDIMYYGAGGGGSQNNSTGNGTFSRGEGGSPGYVRVYFLQS
jgi:hypothetical protein